MVTKQKVAISLILLIVVLAVGLTWLWVGAGLYPKGTLSEGNIQRRRMIGVALKEVDVDLLCKYLIEKVGDVEEVIVVLDPGSSSGKESFLAKPNDTSATAVFIHSFGKPKWLGKNVLAFPDTAIEGIAPELYSVLPIVLYVKPKERSVVALASGYWSWRKICRASKFEAVSIGGE